MTEIKAPARWLRDGEDALAERIADIVVGHQAALPRRDDRPQESGKHQLDRANNWFLRRKDGERDTFVLTYRHGTHWQGERWDTIKAAVELLLQ